MTKMFQKNSILSRLLLVLLIAAMLGSVVSCGEENGDDTPTMASTVVFTFEVVFRDGSVQTQSVETNRKIVGDALQEKGLIDGKEEQYGLYVKTVCGETLDYDTDGMYWAFYIGDEYAMTGVDSTTIDESAIYKLAYTK